MSATVTAIASTLQPKASRDLLSLVDYRQVVSAEDKEEIYRLRYRAYLKEGAIQPNADEMIRDRSTLR